MNLWEELNNSLPQGEALVGVVIGEWGNGYRKELDPPGDVMGRVVSPEEARPWLERSELSDELGYVETYAMTAWTQTRVYTIATYDGVSGLEWLPRDPTDHEPTLVGR